MVKALFFKERIKTRRVFILMLIVGLMLAVYAVLGVRRIEMSKGVEHIWMIMLLKDRIFVDVLTYFPLFAGLILGLCQMIPELSGRRLKLTLHLPLSQSKILGVMLGTGLVELAVIFILQVTIVGCYYASIIAMELVWRVLLTMLPRIICGFNAYLFVSAICIEGEKKMRLILGLIGAATLSIYFKQSMPEAFNGCLMQLLLLCLLTVYLVYLSLIRFKEGRQD